MEANEEANEEACSFLSRFTEEFPAALDQGTALPLRPVSRRVSEEELQGESVELGLRLLSDRGAPSALAALLIHSAVSELLQNDLTALHCPLEDEQPVLLESERVQLLFLNALINSALHWRCSLPALPAVRPRLVSIHAIKNSRRKMEDRHVALPHFSEMFGLSDGVERSFFAVLDGHGGVDAAAFAAVQLPVVLSRQQNLQTNPEEALTQALTETDLMLQRKATRERLRGGSTAVAALFQGQRLLLAWLGDSQALLVRCGREEEVMEVHKPEREDERQRIEQLGGCVTFMGCWRVNGTYAVSRALGDFEQRPYVSSEADVVSLELRGDEDYLLLACDGFFDSVRPSSVPGLVLEALRSPPPSDAPPSEAPPSEAPPSDPQRAALTVAQTLVSRAKDEGSSDNITVMLVFLKPPLQILQESI
uniref:Protein phosphatase, Mg2+/Mn2+ dependent, 1F n=1 Tax=Neogobius melanostomus TaxID=47308 RepID=A0A8C6U4B3_9GOBI